MTLRSLRAAASARCCCSRLLSSQTLSQRHAAAAATGPLSLSPASLPVCLLWRSLPVFSTAAAAHLRCHSSVAAPAELSAQAAASPASAVAASAAPASSDSSTSGNRTSQYQSAYFTSSVHALTSIRDCDDPVTFLKYSNRLRADLFNKLPVNLSGRVPPPPNLDALFQSTHLTVWHYAFLCYHSVRLGAMDNVTRFTAEMEQRGLPVISPLLELLLHASPSHNPDWKTRELLRRLVQQLDAESTERPSPGAPLLPVDAMRRVLFPYDEPCFQRMARHVRRAEYRPRAAASMGCYQFLQAEGLLDIKPAMPLYLRLMRMLLDAEQFVECRQVYGDLVDKGLEETSEGYALVMESLVEEGWQLPGSSEAAAAAAAAEPSPSPSAEQPQQQEHPPAAAAQDASAAASGIDMTHRKRQLVKLKVLTLMQEMRRRKLSLTAEHYPHIIRACCLVQDSRYAMLFYAAMQRQQVVPPITTYHALLSLSSLSPADVAAMLSSMRRTTGWDLEAFRYAAANAAHHRTFGPLLAAFNRIRAEDWVSSPRTGRIKGGGGILDILASVARVIMNAAMDAGDERTVRMLQARAAQGGVRISIEQLRRERAGQAEPRSPRKKRREGQGRVAR